MTLVEIQNLNKTFSNHRTLFHYLNFYAAKGEAHLVLGRSGVGKTVFLRVIAGLERPDAETSEFSSDNAPHNLPQEKTILTVRTSRIGMLFQKNALFNSLTVEENILFPLCEKKSREKKYLPKNDVNATIELTHHWLNAVGLYEARHKWVDEISGGMQKRLGLARALSIEPELLLLDEPTSGLDPITAEHISKLITKLKSQSHCTLILVTNDGYRMKDLGAQVHYLHDGHLSNTYPESERFFS